MATFGPIMPARPRFKLKIGSNLRPSKPNLRPNVPGNAHLEPTMSSNTHLPCHKVLMSMMPKPKQSLMWSRTRIAIELKGLAAPGEALKNYHLNDGKDFGCLGDSYESKQTIGSS